MSARRALVDCVVLSLRDACMFYPSCKGCLSRIEVERPDRTRCRCLKCGYSCSRELVDYRYRLSLRVTRDGSVFGVTVFGTCLNPFFGIHATGLQKLVENFDGPVEASVRSTLLLTAVKDCFIGRRFVFGIKVTEKDNWPCFEGPVVSGSSSTDTVHVIASQMILPNATGLEGCTVVSYYRILLRKAAEYEQGSGCRPPATTLLLIAHHSPASGINNGTLCSSGLSSQSLLRSRHRDCTLTHTPPWQQSLGLVTSSAEQEDGCCTQDCRGETSRETDNFRTPRRAQRRCEEDRKASMVLSPLLSPEGNAYNRSLTAKYPRPSSEEAVGNTPVFNPRFSPSAAGHNCSKTKTKFSTRQLTETFLPNSLAWEDLPFSESLTAFLCDENDGLDNVSGAELDGNVQTQIETARDDLGIGPRGKHSSVCRSDTLMTDTHPQTLLDITNTSALDGGGRPGLSEQVRQDLAGSVGKSRARNIWPPECNQENEKVSPPSFEHADEQHGGDAFDCSADLFSGSLISDVADALNAQVRTTGTTTEADPVLSVPDKRHPRSAPANVPHPDFIPPSQSTPIVKAPASSFRSFAAAEFSSRPDGHRSPPSRRRRLELDCKRSAGATCSLCKSDCVGATQRRQCGQRSPMEKKACSPSSSGRRPVPKRRSWKPNEHIDRLPTRQHFRVQREALSSDSTGRVARDSSEREVTARDHEDGEEVIVPPTPAAETRQKHAQLRAGRRTDESGGTLGRLRDGVHRERTLTDRILVSRRDLALTGNGDSETVDEGSLDASNCCLLDEEEEEEAVDWSRDLFSDSV